MKAWVHKCEDGSTLIEWVAKDMRFSISIEKELKKSSWCFVAKATSTSPMMSEGDYLPEELIRAIKEGKNNV